MSSTLIAPYDFRIPRIDSMRLDNQRAQDYPTYPTALPTFKGSAPEDVRLLEYVLRGMMVSAHEGSATALYGLPARVEFFWNHSMGHETRRGAVIFDDKSEPLLHVVSALLGEEGKFLDLSEHLLSVLGVSHELFEQANEDARRLEREYVLIFSREKIVDVRSHHTALLPGHVGTWTYLREQR